MDGGGFEWGEGEGGGAGAVRLGAVFSLLLLLLRREVVRKE